MLLLHVGDSEARPAEPDSREEHAPSGVSEAKGLSYSPRLASAKRVLTRTVGPPVALKKSSNGWTINARRPGPWRVLPSILTPHTHPVPHADFSPQLQASRKLQPPTITAELGKSRPRRRKHWGAEEPSRGPQSTPRRKHTLSAYIRWAPKPQHPHPSAPGVLAWFVVGFHFHFGV